MAEDVLVAPVRLRAPAFVRFLETEGLVVAVVVGWVALLAVALSGTLVSDSWLALVDGRYVAHHWLPHVDTLTYWSRGHRWIDQQWGAQLVLYWAAAVGGVKAAALLGVCCVGAALGGLAVAARRLGGSAWSTALAVALPLLGAPWLAQLRTQTLALPLFVLVVALLASDSRKPSRRVYAVLPLLVVWANLHGSVSLAAGLVALHGLTRRRWPLAGAPLALVAAPYGLQLAGYYRLMLLHPPLASFVNEWQPMSVHAVTVPFFATAFAATGLWARHRRALTAFEQWALPLLLVAALAAARNAVWFELALALALPRLLDAARTRAEPTAAMRRVNVVAGAVVVVGAACLVGAQLARPLHLPSAAAAAAVSHAAGPAGIVLADDAHADWLLWERPELTGRVAYDVRFELFSARELRVIADLDNVRRAPWRRCGAGMSVVTFHSAAGRRLLRSERVLQPGARLVASTRGFGAFAQTPKGSPCGL